MNKKILQKIEEIFIAKLQSKTSWGKNEVVILYKEAVNEALLEFIN